GRTLFHCFRANVPYDFTKGKPQSSVKRYFTEQRDAPDASTPSESLTKAPTGRHTWLQLKLPKNCSFITPFTVSISHFQTLSLAAVHCRKPGFSPQNPPDCSRGMPRSCKPRSTRSYLETCMTPNWPIGAVLARSDRMRKSAFVIPMMYLFMRGN